MNWEERIIGDADLLPFLPTSLLEEGKNNLRTRVLGLFAQQQQAWPMLREALAGLAGVEYKRLLVRGSETLAQFNPKRIVSTAARVDEASIKRRACFLCLENLPAEEMGIRFDDDLVVLCNPFPVLDRHLVIASRRHTPQMIAGHLGALLDLTGELGEEWITIYNGPRCGASAPDHLHFQASSRRLLPIISEIGSWNRRTVFETAAIEAFTLRDYRLNLLILRGRHRETLIEKIENALGCLTGVTGESEEPMINMVSTCDGGGWIVIVFPRGRHRPSSYYAEGPGKLTVSPAAIDLSGVLVVPQLEHFTRITARDVERIFAEVTLDDARFNEWILKLEKSR